MYPLATDSLEVAIPGSPNLGSQACTLPVAVSPGDAHEGVADAAVLEEEHREQQADAVVQGGLLLSHQAKRGPAGRAEETARPCRQNTV